MFKVFLIMFLILGCKNNSPETIKLKEKYNAECKKDCNEVSRANGSWNFWDGCQCSDKKAGE